LLKISNLGWIEMVNQITMPTNIGIQIRKTSRLPLDQRVITRYTIGVIIVGLMRLKIKKFFKKIDKSKVTSQQSKKVQINIISKEKTSSSKLAKAQELTSHFKSHFVQEKYHVPITIFCNYYCQIGYIPLDYDFRKRSNKIVLWVPKVIT
jgi:K+-sensing histidine kinase KdpD